MSYLLDALLLGVPVTRRTVLTVTRTLHRQAAERGYLGDLVYMAAKGQYKNFHLATYSEHCDDLRRKQSAKRRERSNEEILAALFGA